MKSTIPGVERAGNWGKPDPLPPAVRARVEAFKQPGVNEDWVMFASSPGELWMVCKIYHEEDYWDVVAAKVVVEESNRESEE